MSFKILAANINFKYVLMRDSEEKKNERTTLNSLQLNTYCLVLTHVLFFFMAPPTAYGSSRTQDRTRAAAAMPMPDPLTHCASAAIQAAAVGFLTYCVTVETLTPV